MKAFLTLCRILKKNNRLNFFVLNNCLGFMIDKNSFNEKTV